MIIEEKMKCIVDEWIEVSVNSTTKKYYESLGYSSKNGKFKIHPWQLKPKSNIKIKIKCSKCGMIRLISFVGFYKAKSCLCNKCSSIVQGKNQRKDLVNLKFGRLTVIKDTNNRKNGRIVWLCKCDCGNYCEVQSSKLIKGYTKSCGCLKIEKSIINITDFNRKRNVFVKADHTEEETIKHLKTIKFHQNDCKWNNLSKQIRKNTRICYVCKSGENLHVHHINGYWEFPEQRYNENNLVVLCNKCHNKFHGKYKATKENWIKWLKEIKC